MPLVPRRRRQRSLGAVALLALLAGLAPLCSPATATPASDPTGGIGFASARSAPGPGDRDPVLYDAILPEQRDAIIAQTAGWLSRYRIDALLSPSDGREPGRVAGSLDLRFVNDTDGDLAEVYFRLYANDPEYAEGSLVVDEVAVAGTPIAPELSVDDTVLRVPLPSPLPPAAAVDLRLDFTATVPLRPRESYGIYAIQPATGTWALAHWFPILAGRDAAGWSLDPISEHGDPIFSNTALFDVSLTTPEELVVVATGVAIAEEATGDRVRRRFVSGPVRDFTVVADDDFAAVSGEVDGTTVTSYFNPADAAAGEAVLEYGSRALAAFADLFGPYPYREMDLAQVVLRGAGGVEFPQLMYLGDSLYGDDDRENEHYLEFVTAHEVAHQWFYALVGNNQHVDAFIDEGLAEYASTESYFARVYDAATAERQLDLEVKLWYLSFLFRVGDDVVDQPTDDFPSQAAYGAMVYAKGALGFDAVRAAIGDEAFYQGLRDYVARYRFAIATPPDLRDAFERASGRDLDPLWHHWFEAAEGKEDFSERDYLDLLAELGLRPRGRA